MTISITGTQQLATLISTYFVRIPTDAAKSGLTTALATLGALEVLDSFAAFADHLFGQSSLFLHHLFNVAEVAAALLLFISMGRKLGCWTGLARLTSYISLRLSHLQAVRRGMALALHGSRRRYRASSP